MKADTPEDVSRAAADPKNRFGKYVLLRELGRGGMGAVHLAWDTTLKRRIALKFLLVPGGDEDLRRFQREAETAAALKHPNIAAVYEVGEIEAKPYIAMEYVDGQNLQGLKLTVRRACEVVRQVALALDFAHRRSIIHRDLKPGNILIGKDGKATILDFGLAKSLKDAHRLTVSGYALGTPVYMSPEQAAGKMRELDARSDIYQLGAVLYDLVTGRAPFRGETPAEVLRHVLEDEVTPPSKLATLPADVESVILRAMDKEPARRYPSAKAFADDLGRYLEGRPVQAKPASTLRRLKRSLQRNRAWAVAGAALVLLAAAGAAWLAQRASRADALAERLRQASACFERRQYQEALVHYSGALQLDPDRPDVAARVRECRDQLARIAARAKEAAALAEAEAAAKPDFERGRVELEESMKDLYRQGADLVKMRGRLALAVDAFNEAIRKWPGFPEAHYERGRTRALRFEYDQADRDFTRAVELRPGYVQARTERGKLCLARHVEERLHLGWTWDAKVAAPFEKWMAQARADSVDEAFVAFAQARLQDCLHLLERRLHEKREQEELWKLTGDALWFSSGHYTDVNLSEAQTVALRKAEESYSEALRLRPNYYQARMMRGYVLKALGKLALAIEDVKVAHQLRPDDALACWFMGQAAGSDPARALQWYEEGLKYRPDSFVCRMNRAAGLGQLGRLEESQAELERSMGMNPAHHYPFYLRGALRSRMGKMNEAYEDFRIVTERAPDFYSGWYNLGATAYNLGRFREAVPALERALAAGHPDRARVEEIIRAARQKLR